jgi:hypothetical protein
MEGVRGSIPLAPTIADRQIGFMRFPGAFLTEYRLGGSAVVAGAGV